MKNRIKHIAIDRRSRRVILARFGSKSNPFYAADAAYVIKRKYKLYKN